MTISYKWLSEYLPVTVDPERLSRILTSIGLEVESMHNYEEVRGGLKGLVIGEVLHTEKTALSLEEVAQKAGVSDQIEAVYKIIRHLHANGRGIVLQGNFGEPSSLKISAQ